MSDLATELGMSKKTLYAHFDSKHALIQSVLLQKFASVEADLSQITSGPEADFTVVLQQLLACMHTHAGEIQPAFVRDVQKEVPEMFGLVMQHRRELIQRHFGKVLLTGRKAGMIRADLSLELMIEILVGATDSIVTPPRLAALGLTPKEGYLAVVTLFLEGVISRKEPLS